MPNRSSACTECGYQPALGKTIPVAGYAAVRVLVATVFTVLLAFSVVYARKDLTPPTASTAAQSLKTTPPPSQKFDPNDHTANTPDTFDVRSRSYVNQFVVDYMKTHLPLAKTGDSLAIRSSDGKSLEDVSFIQSLKYRVLVETLDGTEKEVHFAELPDDTRIRTDESFRRQHQRRETERLWKLRNDPKE